MHFFYAYNLVLFDIHTIIVLLEKGLCLDIIAQNITIPIIKHNKLIVLLVDKTWYNYTNLQSKNHQC